MCSKITMFFGILSALSLLLSSWLWCTSACVMSTVLLHRGWLVFWGGWRSLDHQLKLLRSGTGSVVEGWHWQVLSYLRLAYPQHGQGCSDAFILGWRGCHLLPSGLPWSCAKAYTHVQAWFQMYCQNVMYNIIPIKDPSSCSCIRHLSMEIEVQGQAQGASEELLRHLNVTVAALR